VRPSAASKKAFWAAARACAAGPALTGRSAVEAGFDPEIGGVEAKIAAGAKGQ
jgi:hypothetical protein